MGGGVGISLHGSHPVATQNFSFAMPETGIGFFPDIGGGYLLSRCQGKIGWYLGLTGSRIAWQEAVDAGLIRYTIHSDEQHALIYALSQLNWSDDKYADVNALLARFMMPAEQSSFANKQDAIEHCFSQASMPAIFEALDKHRSSWCQQVIKILKTKAPLSLCLTLEQLNRAERLDLSQDLIMEYRMVTHLMTQSDFYEGVRALLIDKDKKPNWQPDSIESVTESLVQAYFAPQHRELMLV